MNRLNTVDNGPICGGLWLRRTMLVGSVLVILAGMTIRGSAHPVPAPAAAVPATQDPRLEDAFWKVCRDCHDPDRIRETRRTRGGWEAVIDTMIQKGALGTDQDFVLVLQYLLANYGMVNMNQALAEDIAVVTGLSQKDAEAIVAYRKEHGNFRDFDALVQVPGVDVKTLEAHRGAIMF